MPYPMIRVVTTSLAGLRENTAPDFHELASAERNLALGLSLLDGAAAQRADLALLPETFVTSGLARADKLVRVQSIDGLDIQAVAERARRHQMFVVAGFKVREDNSVTNRAILFDRNGQIAGSYAKRYPTEPELENGVRPGNGPVVFDTEIGRLGLAICFDANWPNLWQEIRDAGAELVCWISAYGVGLPLQALAWTYGLPIVTSIRPQHSVMIERTGHVSGSTARGNPLGVFDLNLDQRMFHTDFHMDKIMPIIERYGGDIRLVSHTEEHVFTLESLNPGLKIDEVVDTFGLVEFHDYIARCTQKCDDARLPHNV